MLFQALEVDFKKVPALRELAMKCGDQKKRKKKRKTIINNHFFKKTMINRESFESKNGNFKWEKKVSLKRRQCWTKN